RVLDVRTRQLRVVFEDPVAEGALALPALLALDHDDAARHLHHEASGGRPDPLVGERLERRRTGGALGGLARAVPARGAGGARAHLLLGAGGVLAGGKADRYLVGARLLDLRLRDAERVGALADRLDRVADRLGRDLRHLRRRPALVDQLDAALQVEPEPRLL